MPKKGKKGKGKGKKKGKKKSKGPANSDEIMKRLLKCYERNCHLTESQMCPGIRKAMLACIENKAILPQFILESVTVEKEGDLPVLLEPLLACFRQERYTFVKDLYIWQYPMTYENAATLALLLEKPVYEVRLIELMDCLLDALAVQRLSRAFMVSQVLTKLNLDYNEFGDEGCKNLCKGLENNRTLLSLSLCYCDLGVSSGTTLGHILTTTAVRDLYLDGNNLMCDGARELIKLCVEQAEYEVYLKAEAAKKKAQEEEALKTAEDDDDDDSEDDVEEYGSDDNAKKTQLRYDMDSAGETSAKGSDAGKSADEKKKKKKGKKKGKKKKKEPPAPPRVGPWVHKLHLADNAIDNFDFGAKFAPVQCMRLFKQLIMHSDCLEELDLEDNVIGDSAGREILEALEHRKEEKMGGVKIRTTSRLSCDIFNGIVKLGSGLKKKKKKGKKKKK